MAQRLTLAQLSARIDEIERSFAEQFRALEAQQMVAERPSRHIEREHSTALITTNSAAAPKVQMGGQWFYKVRAIEHGRLVTTYKPVQ